MIVKRVLDTGRVRYKRGKHEMALYIVFAHVPGVFSFCNLVLLAGYLPNVHHPRLLVRCTVDLAPSADSVKR